MKINNVARNVHTGSSIESKRVTAEVSAKAFDIVVRGLYPNPIRAILRETWTNAYDSHHENGNPERPFEVHLPTFLTPLYSIRDFGTSMTHEVVMDVFAVLYASTKDNSNIPVGKWGIGGMAPWAYSDIFTLTCYLNGTSRVYSCYMDTDGCPNVDLVHEGTTTEENGVEVSLAVNQKDIEAFHRAAWQVYKGFSVPPIFTHSTTSIEDHLVVNWEDHQLVPITNINGSGTTYEGIYFHPGDISARQGCVIYRLDRTSLSSISEQAKLVLDLNMVIDFEIGEIEPTPDREQLLYDKKTIKNIEARLEGINDLIFGDMVDTIKALPTYHEQIVALGELWKMILEACRGAKDYGRGAKIIWDQFENVLDRDGVMKVPVNLHRAVTSSNRKIMVAFINKNIASRHGNNFKETYGAFPIPFLKKSKRGKFTPANNSIAHLKGCDTFTPKYQYHDSMYEWMSNGEDGKPKPMVIFHGRANHIYYRVKKWFEGNVSPTDVLPFRHMGRTLTERDKQKIIASVGRRSDITFVELRDIKINNKPIANVSKRVNTKYYLRGQYVGGGTINLSEFKPDDHKGKKLYYYVPTGTIAAFQIETKYGKEGISTSEIERYLGGWQFLNDPSHEFAHRTPIYRRDKNRDHVFRETADQIEWVNISEIVAKIVEFYIDTFNNHAVPPTASGMRAQIKVIKSLLPLFREAGIRNDVVKEMEFWDSMFPEEKSNLSSLLTLEKAVGWRQYQSTTNGKPIIIKDFRKDFLNKYPLITNHGTIKQWFYGSSYIDDTEWEDGKNHMVRYIKAVGKKI